MLNIDHVCPYCGHHNDAVDSLGEIPDVFNTGEIRIGDPMTPTDGDISMCAYCGRFAVFEDHSGKLVPRKLTEDENKAVLESSELRKIQFSWMITKMNKGQPS